MPSASQRRYGPDIMKEPVFRNFALTMLQQDPPDHTRLRGLVVKAFTARRVEDMRPRIQQIVDENLDRIIPQGKMDLIEDFAYRLPVTVICDMLGIPVEHREMFYNGARNSGRILEPVPMTPEEIKQGNAGQAMIKMYFDQLFDLRRKNPGDDLTTQLLHAEEDGSKLSNDELYANIILLFGAGHETTVNLIGNGLLALYRNPDQLALLKAKPELITNAIEEFLRYDSSVQMTGRADAGGRRARWQAHSQGRERAVPARFGQPRSGGLPRSAGAARYHPAERQAAVLWRWHPFLPRRPARPHRGGDRDQHPAAPYPRPAAG